MKSLGLIALSLLLSCSFAPCKNQENKITNSKSQEQSIPTVWVYKYDGSKQCGMGQPKTLEETQKELGGIKVLNSKKRPDGLMRAQVCGADTGIANTYEIPKTDENSAYHLGFKEWTH